jgi:hypothetical protein
MGLNDRINRHQTNARSGGISVSFLRIPSPQRSGGAERARKGRTQILSVIDLIERVLVGYVNLLRGSLVSWSSRKQTSVALSTAEAEYIVAESCCT